MQCPRCNTPLTAREVEGVPVEVCEQCTGALVAMNKLVPLLTALAGPMLKVIDLNEPIEHMADDGRRVTCPKCRSRMEAFGYMGTNVVTVDRCSSCYVIWADAEELGKMSILYARTNRRLQENQRKNDAIRMDMARSTHAALAGRMSGNRVAVAMLVGGLPAAAVVTAAESVFKRS